MESGLSRTQFSRVGIHFKKNPLCNTLLSFFWISEAFWNCSFHFFFNKWRWKQAWCQIYLPAHGFYENYIFEVKLAGRCWVYCRWELNQQKKLKVEKVFDCSVFYLARSIFYWPSWKPIIFIVYHVCGSWSHKIYLWGFH